MNLADKLRELRKPTLLTESTRRGLHEIGWTDIHQSSLKKWRECHAYLLHEVRNEGAKRFPVNVLMGSVFHLAVERIDDTREHGGDWGFWYSLFHEVLARDVGVKYMVKGSPITNGHIKTWSAQFTRSDVLGASLQFLSVGIYDAIRARNWKIIATEYSLSFIDGRTYPVRFTGTQDIKVTTPSGAIGILDVKSYGMWGPFVSDDGTPSKQSYDSEQITYAPQLRHYHWMEWVKFPEQKVSFYGIVTPSNLIPYKVGDKKGQPKGDCIFVAPALNESYIRDYQWQVVDSLNHIANKVFTKLMPESFGKPSCPTCPHFDVCMADPTASRIKEAVASNPALAYLKE
jgi:hypothetical protein